MTTREGDTWIGGAKGEFESTLWSVVVRAKDASSPERREALQRLIEIYWKPLYHYVRRRGQSREAAKDTVQSFFTALLEKDLLQYLDPGRAKFRTFLQIALKHHMSDARDREKAVKRGGGRPIFSLDFSAADREYGDDAAMEETPEQTYRREWGVRVLEQALEAVRAEFAGAGREREFDEIKLHLAAGPGEKRSYADLGRMFDVSEGEIAHRIHRARSRFKEKILLVIRSYTETPEQVQEELRDLFSALS